MKYFIGHLLEGEVGVWHTTLTNTIAEKFNTWKIQEICPSHITIFSEFEADNIETVSHTIETLLFHTQPGNYSISMFDHFEDKVVFAKIDPDAKVISLVQKLRENLELIPGVQKDKHLTWKPHATLAFRLSPEKITTIWNYVTTLEKPNFTALFDNITLFRFENEKWVVEKKFAITN